jgi:hypothetical protein
MQRRAFLLTAGAALALPVLAADSPGVIEGPALLADAAILRRAFENLHPGLYRYNSPAQIDAAFNRLDLALKNGATLSQAWLAFAALAATIRCGHTYLNFFNQSSAVQAALLRADRVPFQFRWIDGAMVVTRSFAPGLAVGSTVSAIDGVPASTILARLLPFARADGSNDAKRIVAMEVAGSSRYEAFDVFWPLLFPRAGGPLPLQVIAPDGTHVALRVPMMSYQQRLATLSQQPAKDAPLWELRTISDKVKLLRMPTWAMYNSTWNWQGFLDTVFATITSDGSTDLVIDLRGNEGGNDIGEVILSHLVRAPARRPVVERLVRYRAIPPDLTPYLDTWDKSFRDWGAAATAMSTPLASAPAGVSYLRLRRDADDKPGAPILPAAPFFGGRSWVLLGADNSSATFEFAAMLRQNGIGTLVGQTTGGNQRGINGGAFFFLRLPASGLEIDLPLIGQFPVQAAADAGIAPDIAVPLRAADIAAGRDAELAAVLARISAA